MGLIKMNSQVKAKITARIHQMIARADSCKLSSSVPNICALERRHLEREATTLDKAVRTTINR